MKKDEVKIPRDAPAALVRAGKVMVFDPTNPAHLNWLALMLEGMRHKLGPEALYPPAFDEVLTQPDLAEWVQAQGGYEKTMATRAWTGLWRALNPHNKPWEASLLNAKEVQAGVIPLGLLVGKAPFLGSLRGSAASLNQWQDLVRAYLRSRGLRVGMDTRMWLTLREQRMNQSTPQQG